MPGSWMRNNKNGNNLNSQFLKETNSNIAIRMEQMAPIPIHMY